jgi:hypothetical protein
MPGQHQLAKAAIDAHTHGPAPGSSFQKCSRSTPHIEDDASVGFIAIHFLPVVQQDFAIAHGCSTARAFLGEGATRREKRHVLAKTVGVRRNAGQHFRQDPGIGTLASHGNVSIECRAEIGDSSDDRIRVRPCRAGALKLAIPKGDERAPATRASKAG